jgi:hypothetical protein
VIDLRAPRIAFSMAGKVCSPLSNTSILLPPKMGASVCAAMVGKKVASPTIIGSILLTGVGPAQPRSNINVRNRIRIIYIQRSNFLKKQQVAAPSVIDGISVYVAVIDSMR